MEKLHGKISNFTNEYSVSWQGYQLKAENISSKILFYLKINEIII